MMNVYARKERAKLSYKILSAFIAFAFSFTFVVPPSYAQSIASLNLPVPGTMVTPSAAFVPVLLKGMTIHPENPLQFDFIIDSGNTGFKEDKIKAESERLVKYFLASMTIPKDDLWVNLSPYEKDRIIPDELGKTELGRDMLAQDYILKQLTASLMYPEKELGKEFWSKVYQKAQEKYGTTEIPVDTFNKVWILPETATVYEHGQTVYIVDAKLKVMLDSDYEAMQYETKDQRLKTKDFRSDESSVIGLQSSVSSEIIKEIILPEIEREVNEGQNFAPLRQIYHSLILAKWYKETIKNSLLSKIYVDQKKIAGVNIDDATLKDQIYAQYMEAYKRGVFNYIKEDYDRLSNEVIPRKYFSGGEFLRDVEITRVNQSIASKVADKPRHMLHMELAALKKGKSSSPISEKQAETMIKEKLRAKYPDHPEYIELIGHFQIQQVIWSGGIFEVEYQEARIEKELIYNWNWHADVEFDVPYPAEIKIIRKISSSSPVSVHDLLNVPVGLIGALEENSRILSVKAGEIFDIGFGDYWSQIQGFAAEHPQISAVSGLLAAGITITGGLYYYWSRYTVSGNIHRLNNDNWAIRKDAAIKLGELEDTSAVEPLIPMLKDSHFSVPSAAAEALGKLGDKRAVEPLLQMLNDPNPDVRSAAAEALGKLGDKRAIEFLIPMLKDYSLFVRRAVVKALGRLGATKEQMGEGYLNALGSPSPFVQSDAAKALENLGDKRAVEPLLQMLNDPNRPVQSAAVEALIKLGDKRAVDPLIKLLGDHPAFHIQILIVEMLGKLGDQKAIDSLIRLLEDPYPSVRTAAAEALMPYLSWQDVKTQRLVFTELRQSYSMFDAMIILAKFRGQDFAIGAFTQIYQLAKAYASLDIPEIGGKLQIYASQEKLNRIEQSVEEEIGLTTAIHDYENEKVLTLLLPPIPTANEAAELVEGVLIHIDPLLDGLQVEYQITFGGNLSDRAKSISLVHWISAPWVFEPVEGAFLYLGDKMGLLIPGEITIKVHPDYPDRGGVRTDFRGRLLMPQNRRELRSDLESLQMLAAGLMAANKPPETANSWEKRSGEVFQQFEKQVTELLKQIDEPSKEISRLMTLPWLDGDTWQKLYPYLRDLFGKIKSPEESDRNYLLWRRFRQIRHDSAQAISEILKEELAAIQDQKEKDQFKQMIEGLNLKWDDTSSSPVVGHLTTNPGGIDMNTIDLDRGGAGVDIQFDPVELQELIDAGIDGFAPVIINITPLPSVLPLLGLEPAIKEEPLELSSSG